MSHDTLMIAVNWYGPFISIKAAGEATRIAETGEALYLGISNKHKRTRAYIGKAADVSARLSQWAVNHELPDGHRDLWIGVIVSQNVPGRPTGGQKLHSSVLTEAERTLIYSLHRP
jgi:hypothetical protein